MANTSSSVASLLRETLHLRGFPISLMPYYILIRPGALEPLERTAEWKKEEVGELAETFPSGL